MIKDFIKKIGTGPHGVRDLTRSEAGEAARILLSGTATPAQTGALLLGLRLKGETADEMGGFLDALRAILPPSPSMKYDLDIGDPYDGKTRAISLVVPAAIAASEHGLRIVLHGLSGVPVKQGPGVLEAWHGLGRRLSSLSEAGNGSKPGKVVCLSQKSIFPGLARLLTIRQELGLRTLWNTVEKSANPLSARAQVIGIFHEPIIEKLRKAMEKGGVNPAQRILFVCGSEGGVDLYTHRATLCHLLDPASGPELTPVTIPPPPGNTGPLPPPVDDSSMGQFLREISQDPSHPMSIHLKRQTALFLFASGKYPSFTEAENALAPLPIPEVPESLFPQWSRP